MMNAPSRAATEPSNGRKPACPYAVALEDDEQSQHSVDHYLAQAKKSCPAFAGECPFSNAKSPDELRQTLSKVPESHYKETSFREALRHLHTIGPSVERPEFRLSECPVSTYLKNEPIAFAEAMEEFSLASIMSRMARDLEQKDEGYQTQLHNHLEVRHAVTSMDATPLSSDTSTDAAKTAPLLSQAFKSGTAVAHQAAEDVHFVKNFVQGKIDRTLYADMILGLAHVYAKLEVLLEQHASVSFPTCHFPHQLNRTAALQEDLDFWHGTHKSFTDSPSLSSLPMSPATRDYINRLDVISDTNPLLLLSHAYTRYLGDLSGGKVLARVARRALNLGKHDGLAFYDFEHIPSAKVFKDEYRRALDNLNLTTEDVQALVQEANVAFLLNMRLFEELDVKANVPGAKVRDLEETLSWLHAPASSTGEPASDQCPFLVKQKLLPTGNSTTAKGGRCPWPFVFFHDPIVGLQDYQTWIVVGLLLAWMWSYVQ